MATYMEDCLGLAQAKDYRFFEQRKINGDSVVESFLPMPLFSSVLIPTLLHSC